MTLEERADAVLLKAQRANAYHKIYNLTSGHLYCYRAQDQMYEINNFWTNDRKDTMSYFGTVGYDDVVAFYVGANQKMRNAKLELIHKYYPEIEVCPENDGMGDMVCKTAMSPYVIVSGDGKTAKGFWFSPGACAEVGADGNPKISFMQEKLCIDFRLEDDGWKIWNLKTYLDCIFDLPSNSFTDDTYTGRTFNYFEDLEDRPEEPQHKLYSVTTKADFNPPLPQPYKTWDRSMAF
jgi:hypothetical protein